jgi:hypothetical protein
MEALKVQKAALYKATIMDYDGKYDIKRMKQKFFQ